ncbi:MAG: NAD(P)-dependent oxidoreductase, partial [Paracoccus sp. (in: a-proteobacteria)]|nr:NAD(P)-dependent oxidoreductase [Paracoccus sp. (in: a-proteobacteria)]
ISVSTIGGYGDQAVAQHAIALALAAIRQIAAMDRDIRSGIWLPRLGREFGEMTFGIMGMGGIGRATAELALGLGFDVIGWNRSPLSSAPCRMVSFDKLLSDSDILSLHLALTPDTTGLLDARALSRMRKDAILVNTARAGLLDHAALVAALDQDALAHAALDVFEQEPLPLADPLLARSDVTLSAHAGFKTDAAMRRLLVAALKQME